MIQNLKVDVIYHLTPSDFEMEFNLCGCCRMRLLNDKTNDKKSFVRTLARDVARSRVIIACGPLFGSESIIATVATAIGNGQALCDNKTYGIQGDDEIYIINGSTPLVTPEGYFGGCIIESGPQTIILLTENKAFRKSILQNLIHPYIEEISYIPTKSPLITAQVPTETEEFETAVSEEENYLAEVDEYETQPEPQEENVLPAQENEHNVEFVMDDDSAEDNETPAFQPPKDENYTLMYTEVESRKESKKNYSNTYTPSENDKIFISAQEENDEMDAKRQKEKKEKSVNITLVLLFMLLVLSVLAVVYLLVLRPMTMGADVGEYIKEIFGAASSNTIV